MKSKNLMILGLALALAATGCHKKPPGVTMLPNNGRMGGGPRMYDPNAQSQLTPAQPLTTTDKPVEQTSPFGIPLGPGHPPSDWNQDRELLKTETVYFEFDKSAIKASEQSKLDAVASYLKSNPTYAVLIEGNCDERGTEEYNRSLGERRALASREQLVTMGIDPSRIDTITYGEDKPAVQGHDEAAWSKNRRDEFVVLTPKNAQVAEAK